MQEKFEKYFSCFCPSTLEKKAKTESARYYSYLKFYISSTAKHPYLPVELGVFCIVLRVLPKIRKKVPLTSTKSKT